MNLFTICEIINSLKLIGWLELQGQVVQKMANAHPGGEFNQTIQFSCPKIFPTFVLCISGFRLSKYKTKG